MTKIEIKGLCFAYDKQPILQNLSLDIQAETINVLLGLNGSGKTTLIKLIVGILQSKQGQIMINGNDIAKLSSIELSKSISYVPQQISNDNDFLVLDYLTFGRMNSIKFYSSPKKEDYEKATAIAHELGIEQLLNKKMNELSGGQRQLVVIARAVVQDSEIILMDEPTSSIDYKYLDKVIRYLNHLQHQGKTIILSCHNPSIPLLLNSNVIILEQGNLKTQGVARNILTNELLKEVYGCELISVSELPYQEVSLCPVEN